MEGESADNDRRVGTTLRGKYHLDRVLGSGGMAVVYAATHVNNAKRFAIKVLHSQISADAEMRRRFLREGYIANKVEHAGAVAVLDDDVTEDGAAFLVMELLEGENLDAIHQRVGKLDHQTILAIAHALLDVLGAAHAKGIVHRDVKPANLLLTRDGVKILDFGIARIQEPGTKITLTQSLLGTPSFMAPEQAGGETEAIGPHSDIWAVGATLFFLLSNEPVHVGKNAGQVLVKAASTPARSLASIAPDVPRSIIAIVDKAIAFQRHQRWESAAAMREAIAEAWKELYREPLESISFAPLLHPNVGQVSSQSKIQKAWAAPASPTIGSTLRAIVAQSTKRPGLLSSRARVAGVLVALVTMGIVGSAVVVKTSMDRAAAAARAPDPPPATSTIASPLPSAEPTTEPAPPLVEPSHSAPKGMKPPPKRPAARPATTSAPSVDPGSFR